MAVSNSNICRRWRCVPARSRVSTRSSNYRGMNCALDLHVHRAGHWGEHWLRHTRFMSWGGRGRRPMGMLGLWYPWLIKSEALHYGYALVMLIGIWVLRKGFTGVCAYLVDGGLAGYSSGITSSTSC